MELRAPLGYGGCSTEAHLSARGVRKQETGSVPARHLPGNAEMRSARTTVLQTLLFLSRARLTGPMKGQAGVGPRMGAGHPCFLNMLPPGRGQELITRLICVASLETRNILGKNKTKKKKINTGSKQEPEAFPRHQGRVRALSWGQASILPKINVVGDEFSNVGTTQLTSKSLSALHRLCLAHPSTGLLSPQPLTGLSTVRQGSVALFSPQTTLHICLMG